MKGRFAPSPTGYIHLGNVWIALLSYISTRQQKGTYVVRMEDIDLQRSKRELGEALLDDLEWLGFEWDEGPRVGGREVSYWQSERQTYYADILEHLRLEKLIYPCFCNRARLQSIASAPHIGEVVHRYDGKCRDLHDIEIQELCNSKEPSLRLAIDSCDLEFDDRWQGKQHIHLESELDDYVLRRGDGMYAYNLAVVLDDIAMGITEVIRGDDLLDTTGQQLYLYNTLQQCYPHKNIVVPKYGHAPLLVDTDGHRLSKRQKSITIRELREQQWSASRILGELAVAGGLIDGAKYSHSQISLSDLIHLDLSVPSLRQKTIVIE
ncbi:tRNA glutamyl-Q(34) synthetase GluQRS [uncultured Veillonella sp.]|uniref:tRNA glutamyl-Q(34) synthetase GluQRS n=1 Tax=uncultured Veillonella sp. TaxID=159268 RepID=UPI0025CE8703|nr:tRNA glutamyl-Q(34) synthetase GluQRS [uncultured Veillonella sp.]